MSVDRDTAIRLAAFDWLQHQVDTFGEVLSWPLLLQGFTFDGRRVPLVSQQGIFKPAVLPVPLSIRTSHEGPYADSFTESGLLLYKYRGTDPGHRDNVGLREAMQESRPLAYFHGVLPGRYLACWPVYIVGDDPGGLTFTIALDDAAVLRQGRSTETSETEIRRRYLTATVRRRLHQHAFRERVLAAYRSQCAMCRLRHNELLDASHIVPDKDELGEPRVDNGLALCKIHHAAFDRHILGVTPEYRILVREDVLREVDGPMLRYGLQQLHDSQIVVPRRANLRPRPELLEVRFEEFRRAG